MNNVTAKAIINAEIKQQYFGTYILLLLLLLNIFNRKL